MHVDRDWIDVCYDHTGDDVEVGNHGEENDKLCEMMIHMSLLTDSLVLPHDKSIRYLAD